MITGLAWLLVALAYAFVGGLAGAAFHADAVLHCPECQRNPRFCDAEHTFGAGMFGFFWLPAAALFLIVGPFFLAACAGVALVNSDHERLRRLVRRVRRIPNHQWIEQTERELGMDAIEPTVMDDELEPPSPSGARRPERPLNRMDHYEDRLRRRSESLHAQYLLHRPGDWR